LTGKILNKGSSLRNLRKSIGENKGVRKHEGIWNTKAKLFRAPASEDNQRSVGSRGSKGARKGGGTAQEVRESPNVLRSRNRRVEGKALDGGGVRSRKSHVNPTGIKVEKKRPFPFWGKNSANALTSAKGGSSCAKREEEGADA